MAYMELDRGRRHASFSSPLAALRTLAEVARSRRALSRLESHDLNDIGISRAEALAEAHKPSWQVPASWRR